MDAERLRLEEDRQRQKNWKRWGPYLSERQWGTVREDYSADGSCWNYFPHDHARSRAYRWGEDGLFGFSDRECRLCLSFALWNEKDSILKERLFGLTGPEGNHGEDVKECYYYLESTPTHSYCKGLYKYPQIAFPYQLLVSESTARGRHRPEFELTDTGIFNENKYFDVFIEYAKQTPDEIVIKITIENCSNEAAPIHLLPTIWFRNSWAWGRTGEGYTDKPSIQIESATRLSTKHPSLESFVFEILSKNTNSLSLAPSPLITENHTNATKLFGLKTSDTLFKDGFHEYLINKNLSAVAHNGAGTKAAFHISGTLAAKSKEEIVLVLRPSEPSSKPITLSRANKLIQEKIKECNEFYQSLIPTQATSDEKNVMRQAYAGLLWSKQFYYYAVKEWLEGDPAQPKPADSRKSVRNDDWGHLYNRDIISMPDKWEYPWYAAWDLAFHMIPFAKIDPTFAKQQLVLFLREWYMHPNGQLPAYEFAFSDVNPPVHAWACWRTYKLTGPAGSRDLDFLRRTFLKLLLNFNWWVNRKDPEGNNLFSGGFLGLDNIGVFDRSQPLPVGGELTQADGTAWMAFYSGTMLSMALELAITERAYGDVASKFFEHFIAITDSMNHFGGTGLWDEQDGFYYDQIRLNGHVVPLKVRSLVGIIPLLAVEVLEDKLLKRTRGFEKRMQWFMQEKTDLSKHISYMIESEDSGSGKRLLAIPSRVRLERILRYLLDENEFLSPYGIRSLSKVHEKSPYVFMVGKEEYRVDYVPGESTTAMFGGNSNWRGPVWLPLNYLLIEALERYHHFYQDSLKVECPTGSGNWVNLRQVSKELSRRLSNLFLFEKDGNRPCHAKNSLYQNDQHWKDLVLFYEYFHGDNGGGCGASHQTGWTALVTRCIERCY
jgi:Glycosyl hydrolase family 63 C-terminal domain